MGQHQSTGSAIARNNRGGTIMNYFYTVMYKVNGDFLGECASYVDNLVSLKGLTEVEISQFEGAVNRIDQLGFNPDDDPEIEGLSIAQLNVIIDQLLAQEPNDSLAVLSIHQGKWLYANHPDFKPVEEPI